MSSGNGSVAAAQGAERPERRRHRWVALAIVIAFVCLDLAWGPPPERPSTRLAVAAIDGYQFVLSPVLAKAGARCRFEPSCSHYGEGAIRAVGVWRGVPLAFWRIARCGPWTPHGTVDPPPQPTSQRIDLPAASSSPVG
ncbi:MAG: membrane protein insertion efficiency factor YidD [Acidobacteriota bacterium]